MDWKMDKIFQALASSTRRQILAYLSEGGMNAGDIAKRFDVAKPTISKHLEILENAGLVSSEKRGQFVHYSLVRASLVNNMVDFLTEFCPVAGPIKDEVRLLSTFKVAEHE